MRFFKGHERVGGGIGESKLERGSRRAAFPRKTHKNPSQRQTPGREIKNNKKQRRIPLPAGHCDFNFGGRDRGVERVEVAYGRHAYESVAHPVRK